MAVILIVEDEVELARLVSEQLQLDGHETLIAENGLKGLEMWEEHRPDLIILDWMLPEMDGVEVCREIRRHSIVPVLMLTARGNEMERVWGLEVGADDYMTKPFSMRELQARVRALLRRVALMRREIGVTHAEKEINHGFIRLLPDQREVLVDGTALDLTPKEYELLKLFLTHPGRVFSRAYLLEKVWDIAYDGTDRSVDTHVSRLRRKLGAYSGTIQTVWGSGYKFLPNSAATPTHEKKE